MIDLVLKNDAIFSINKPIDGLSTHKLINTTKICIIKICSGNMKTCGELKLKITINKSDVIKPRES
jgi:hypothetical protein